MSLTQSPGGQADWRQRKWPTFSDWGTADPANPTAEYRVPNWAATPAGMRWREVPQDRIILPERVGREPLYAWEAKVYALENVGHGSNEAKDQVTRRVPCCRASGASLPRSFDHLGKLASVINRFYCIDTYDWKLGEIAILPWYRADRRQDPLGQRTGLRKSHLKVLGSFISWVFHEFSKKCSSACQKCRPFPHLLIEGLTVPS